MVYLPPRCLAGQTVLIRRAVINQTATAAARPSGHELSAVMKCRAASTQAAQPTIPATAPLATSAAARSPSLTPAILTAEAITAGKAAKTPPSSLTGEYTEII